METEPKHSKADEYHVEDVVILQATECISCHQGTPLPEDHLSIMSQHKKCLAQDAL
jgi:hypothetical protein